MRAHFLIIILIFNIVTAIGQDSIRKFELGSTVLTINSSNSSSFFTPSKPQFEIINGLFFRITKKRLGLRFNVSFSEVNLKSENDLNCADCIYGNANHKNIILGLGGQFSLIKTRDWLYTFIDLNYRNVFSSGYISGGNIGYNDNFAKTSNGIEFNSGIACKLKIFKSIYLSPETGYSIYYASVNEKITSLTFNTTTVSQSILMDVSPFFKLHLTVSF